MSDNELGEQPTPTTEEPEQFPGGADSIEDEEKYGERLDGAARDLDPEKNPAVEEHVPDEITEPDDDKEQAPEGKADDQETGEEDSPEAGQEDEKGDPEAPA